MVGPVLIASRTRRCSMRVHGNLVWEIATSNLDDAALQRNRHGMGSVVRSKFRQNLPHMSLDGFLRNLEIVGNDFVGVAGSHLPPSVGVQLIKRTSVAEIRPSGHPNTTVDS